MAEIAVSDMLNEEQLYEPQDLHRVFRLDLLTFHEHAVILSREPISPYKRSEESAERRICGAKNLVNA